MFLQVCLFVSEYEHRKTALPTPISGHLNIFKNLVERVICFENKTFNIEFDGVAASILDEKPCNEYIFMV